MDTNETPKQHGLPNAPVDLTNPNFVGVQIPEFDGKQQLEEVQKIPVCKLAREVGGITRWIPGPNGLKAMH